MVVLGNIFRGGIVNPDNVDLGQGIRLNASSWQMNEGVTKPFSARGAGDGPLGGGFEFSKQVLAFNAKGDFIFKGHHPESVRILNWHDIQKQLILKLTQICYSFRELYVVTESVTLSDWTLAIAGCDKAELEIATEDKNFGLADIFGHESARTIQSKDIEFYHRETGRKPSFFKAKKLTVPGDKKEIFINELIRGSEDHYDWAKTFFDYGFQLDNASHTEVRGFEQADVLDMLQANQLNPATALEYFKWCDANSEDIEKLFFAYD